MKKTVFWWIAIVGLGLGAYVQYTGCSVDGLPKVVRPTIRAAQAACTSGGGYVGAKLAAVPKAAQPHLTTACSACTRGSGYVGSKLAVLGDKLGRGCQWVGAKASALFQAVFSRIAPQKASSTKRQA